MPAEKTDAVILSVAPYRESSCILRLYTRTRGLVHGIAKGIRKAGKSQVPIDRGFLIEALVYHKPNRELQTLGSLHIANFFPTIRSDIIKSALRDVALELYLKTITHHGHPHPELYELIVNFLCDMDGSDTKDRDRLYPPLWRFIYRYCAAEGFGIETRTLSKYGIDDAVARYIIGTGNDFTTCPRGSDLLDITENLLEYCRNHFDVPGQFNSLEFVRSMG